MQTLTLAAAIVVTIPNAIRFLFLEKAAPSTTETGEWKDAEERAKKREGEANWDENERSTKQLSRIDDPRT